MSRIRIRSIVVIAAVGGLLGWLAASGRLSAVVAQDTRAPQKSALPKAASQLAAQQQPTAASSAPRQSPVLPRPEAPFGGRISRKVTDSTSDFPHEVVAPKGAPNVLVILTDDVGFGATFDYDGGGVGKGGKVTMTADDQTIAEGRIENTIPFRVSLDETLDIGEDTGTAVSNDYAVPFEFTGKLNRVLVRLDESKLTAEDEEQIWRAKAAIGIAQ